MAKVQIISSIPKKSFVFIFIFLIVSYYKNAKTIKTLHLECNFLFRMS